MIAIFLLGLSSGLSAHADEVTPAGETVVPSEVPIASEPGLEGGQPPPLGTDSKSDAAAGPWAPPEPGSESDPAIAAWTPPALDKSAKDWVKLTSGEWLTGELHRMRDGDVEFESDELDLLTIDFGDIAEFRSPRPHFYRFEGRRIHEGAAAMKGGKIRITTQPRGEVLEFDRRKLVSVVAGDGSELDYWSIRLSAGATARSGNTDQTDISGTASVSRGTALTRWISAYNGAFSTVNSDTNENNHRVRSTFDIFATRRFYITAPYFEYFTDRFQNIDLRITPGVLAGFEVLDIGWFNWEILGGPAYQRTMFTDVETGDREANDFAVIAGTTLNFDFPRDIEFDSTYQIQMIATDFDKTSHHWLSTLSFKIWGPLDLDVSFTLDRIEQPTRESSGSRPESNDYRLAFGLGLEWP